MRKGRVERGEGGKVRVKGAWAEIDVPPAQNTRRVEFLSKSIPSQMSNKR